MKQIWNLSLKGLIAILPIGITLYLIYWLGTIAETFVGHLLKKLIPGQYYWPGMGLISGFVILLLLGIVVNAWVVKKMIEYGDDMFNRIPLVKTVYSAIKDFLHYFSNSLNKQKLQRVYLADFGTFQLLGFATLDTTDDLPFANDLPRDVIAVYFPMSYQVGGYTLYISRSRLQPVDISIEEAMRLTLTAGLSGAVHKENETNTT